MKHTNLGPHTFMTPAHEPKQNHAWLTSFTPRERHEQIDDDVRARIMTVGIIGGAFVFGLAMLIVVLMLAT